MARLLRDWLFDNYDRVADTMQEETGKVRGDAAAEAVYLTDLINFYGSKADKFIGEEKVRPHSPLLAVEEAQVLYRPYPVVGVISPWNFPLILSLGDAIPALQAGAAVVIKPSEFTPLGLTRSSAPGSDEIGGPDVLDVVNGTGDTGGALVDNADYIQFTGSDRTGSMVMARAAETLTPVSLELGGKDPMIVLDDADLDRAANAAALAARCQLRPGLHLGRADLRRGAGLRRVRRQADQEVGKLRQGATAATSSKDVGAMTSPNQTAIVEDHVNDARRRRRQGADRRQARDGPGDYFEPTVLVDVDHSMKVMRDETFGPVVGVMKVSDSEEAREAGQRLALRALGLGLRREGAAPSGSRAGSTPARSTSTT